MAPLHLHENGAALHLHENGAALHLHENGAALHLLSSLLLIRAPHTISSLQHPPAYILPCWQRRIWLRPAAPGAGTGGASGVRGWGVANTIGCLGVAQSIDLEKAIVISIRAYMPFFACWGVLALALGC